MAGEKSENGVNAFPYMKPPTRTAWEKFSQTLYNKSDNTILGRTGKGWGQLLVFYTIFYIGLAALFAICMQGLFSTLDDSQPRWTLEDSLIGTNPGMGFRPISDDADEGSLIAINSMNASSVQKYVDLMNVFLQDYSRDSTGTNRVPCSYDKPPGKDQVCDVALDEFGDCSPMNNFNYNTSSPCIFLKLNRIFNWVPDYYNDINNLPDDMPDDLKDHITMEYHQDPRKANQVWVSCMGEKEVDKENINNGRPDSFEFFPTRGFPNYYYPFTNIPNYLSPLIAVKVLNINTHVVINVECRAWAKNIEYVGSYRDRMGSVHFEVMRD